jgi:hypothetical protein
MNLSTLPQVVFSKNDGFCFADIYLKLYLENPDCNELDLELKIDVYLDNLERHGVIRRGTRDGVVRGGGHYWFPGLKPK